MEKVCYLYGFIGCADLEQGIDLPCKTAELGKIMALYSAEDKQDFGNPSFRENLKNIEWVKIKVIKHNQILTEIQEQTTVLPVKFGSIYSNLDSLEKDLRSTKEDYLNTLTLLNNRNEWGLKLGYNNSTLIDFITSNVQEVKEAKRLMEFGTPGQKFIAKNKFSVALKSQIKQLINKLRNEVRDKVLNGDYKYKTLALTPKDLEENNIINVLNFAMLVDRGAEEDVKSWVKVVMNEISRQGFSLEITGPWPPYNFSEDE